MPGGSLDSIPLTIPENLRKLTVQMMQYLNVHAVPGCFSVFQNDEKIVDIFVSDGQIITAVCPRSAGILLSSVFSCSIIFQAVAKQSSCSATCLFSFADLLVLHISILNHCSFPRRRENRMLALQYASMNWALLAHQCMSYVHSGHICA